jgi:serine/threonine protein kinase
MQSERPTFDEDDRTREWLPGDTAHTGASARSRPAAPSGSSAPADAPRPVGTAAPQVHRCVGRFELLELVGRGGMGEVWRAMHVKLRKQVALKLLAAERLDDAGAVARFRREIRLVSELEHPNIVRFENAGEADGVHYLVMEYVRGIDLDQLVRRLGPLGVPEACQLIGQAAVGLRYAHARGLVHRDVKPSNLMLSESGALKVLDLGLALLREGGEELTSSGRTLGTAEYMAPEQAEDSRSVDHRTDLYSLGCTLFKLLTGRPPFSQEELGSPQHVVLAHVSQPAPSLRSFRGDVPETLSVIVGRLLAKDPAERFESAADLARALAPFAEGCDVKGLLSKADLTCAPAEVGQGATVDSAEYLTSSVADLSALNLRGGAERSVAASGRMPKWGWQAAGLSLALLAAGLLLTANWSDPPADSDPAPQPVSTVKGAAGNSHPMSRLDWDEIDLPEPATVSRKFAFDGLELKVVLEGDLEFSRQHDSPGTTAPGFGGLTEKSLLLATAWSDPEHALRAVLEFSAPVKAVSFRLLEIDGHPQTLQDQVTVAGLRAGSPVQPMFETTPAHQLDSQAGRITGIRPVSSSDRTSANATVRFEQEVDQIEIAFTGVGPQAGRSRPQSIALHDLAFTSARPFGPTCTVDWDQEAWGGRQRVWNVSGVTFTLLGDGAQAGNQKRHLNDSKTLDEQPLDEKALVWTMSCARHESMGLAIDFSQSAADVSFDLLGLDRSDLHADRVWVTGSRGGRLVQPVEGLEADAVLERLNEEPSPFAAFAQRGARVFDHDSAVRFNEPVDRILLWFENAAPPAAANTPLPNRQQQVALGDISYRLSAADTLAHAELPAELDLFVPATASPWLTSEPRGAQDDARDAAPGESPVQVQGLVLQTGSALALSAAGVIRQGAAPLPRGPDGGAAAQPASQPGLLSGPLPGGGLVGLFLGDGPPAVPHPSSKVSGAGSARFSATIGPRLAELFFIGDGRTPDGRTQQFLVPPGATRLLLGVMDETPHCDNVGAFLVRVRVVPSAPATIVASARAEGVHMLVRDLHRLAAAGAGQAEGTDNALREILSAGAVHRIQLASGAYQVTLLQDGEVLRQPSLALAPGEELQVSADYPSLDVLPLVDLRRDFIDSTGSWLGDALDFAAEANRRAVLQIPVEPPEQYQVRLKVERIAGQGSFGVGLPAGGGQLLAMCDELNEDQPSSGILHGRDGKPVFDARTEGAVLPLGKTVELEISVGADSVRVDADGRTLVDWHGDPPSLALLPAQSAYCKGILFLHNFQSHFRIHELALVRSGTARPLPLSRPGASAHRLAAERVLWKGGKLRLAIGDKPSPYVESIDDLPETPTLYGIYPRDSNIGLALDNDDLSLLAGLNALRDVGLNHARITDEGLVHLSGLTNVEWLILSNTGVSDDGLAHLRGLTNVKTLFLLGTDVGDAGMSHLRGMTQLSRVGMSSTKIGDAGIATLAPCLTDARWVCFCKTKMTGAALAELARLPQLVTLHTGDVAIADRQLEPLYAMPSLKEVRLTGTQVTEAGKQQLLSRKPGIKLLP